MDYTVMAEPKTKESLSLSLSRMDHYAPCVSYYSNTEPRA